MTAPTVKTVEISEDELAEYQQLKELAEQRKANGDNPAPAPVVASRALLGDGTTYDYTGAHPTHVDTGAGIVPVLAVHNV